MDATLIYSELAVNAWRAQALGYTLYTSQYYGECDSVLKSYLRDSLPVSDKHIFSLTASVVSTHTGCITFSNLQHPFSGVLPSPVYNGTKQFSNAVQRFVATEYFELEDIKCTGVLVLRTWTDLALVVFIIVNFPNVGVIKIKTSSSNPTSWNGGTLPVIIWNQE